jgi:uncharacterized protein YecT (DUF1311 family)
MFTHTSLNPSPPSSTLLSVGLALSVSLAALSTAHAASFDCAKATSAAEKLICATPALSSLDEELAKAYKTLREELDPKGQALLKESQKRWLRYWPVICSEDPTKLKSATQDPVCIQELYLERLKVLTLDRDRLKGVMGGLSLYQLTFDSANTPHPDLSEVAFRPFVDHDISFPQLVTKNLTGEALALAQAVNVWLSPSQEDLKRLGDRESETSVQSALSVVTPRLWSVAVTSNFMGLGAAHPVDTSSNKHFLVAHKRALTAADVFAKQGWPAKLARLTLQAIKAQLSADVTDSDSLSLKELERLAQRPESWRFTARGLVVEFNVYEIASYASGPQEVTLAWASLEPLLAPSFKEELKLIKLIKPAQPTQPTQGEPSPTP